MLDQIRADIRWALRRLRTSLGYAIVSVVTLGLGIGASTARTRALGVRVFASAAGRL